MSANDIVRAQEITPRWVELKRDGKVAWLDMVDGKFTFGGDMQPTESAQVFLQELGHLLDDRVQEAAKRIAAETERRK